MCTSGRENLCEQLGFFGCGYSQGGMADAFTVPADRLYPVPETLDDQAAALIEPLATPVHAVRLAGDVAGRSVAILGAGTIGLFTLAVLRAHGAGKVVSTDPNLAKRHPDYDAINRLMKVREDMFTAGFRPRLGLPMLLAVLGRLKDREQAAVLSTAGYRAAETEAGAQRWADAIKGMARISNITAADAPPPGAVQLLVRGETVALPLRGVIDLIGAVGYYSLVSMVLNVDGVPLPAGETPPLKPLG